AILFLRAYAKKYNFDPERFGVWGSWAGGLLCALLGVGAGVKELEGDVGGNAEQSSAVQAVCNWFGPTDLAALMPSNISERDRPLAAAAGARMLEQFLGCPATSCAEKWRLASPVTHVNKGDAPMLIMHGDMDPLVPLTQSTKLLELLKGAEIRASLHVVKGAGHGFAGEEHLKRVAEFFETELKPAKGSTPATKPAEGASGRP
ncbi:MAG: prolyl oligopeptidase family serine peptidase, partial [Phycisphaerales bacterium]